MTGAPVYSTREAVMDALDIKASAYRSGQIDRGLEAGARNIDSLCRRTFYPQVATKSFGYPNDQDESDVLWLDGNELYSVSTFTSGGVTVPGSGYYLEPQNYGPPYDHIEINQGSSYGFSAGSAGPQRSLVISGVWMGCDLVESANGTASIIASTAATSITLTAPCGVGSILRIDSERMIVTEKTFTSSAMIGSLTSSLADQSLAVSDGTQYTVREILLIDNEQVQVLAITGNVLIVKRAVQGSVLAAHTTATIYWSRTFIVTRGALGTTAATHAGAAAVYRYEPPPLIEQLNVAYALDRVLQEIAGYARTVGSGDNERSASSRAIVELEKDVRKTHGRLARFRSV